MDRQELERRGWRLIAAAQTWAHDGFGIREFLTQEAEDIEAYKDAAVLAERERCAKIAQAFHAEREMFCTGPDIAARIREEKP